MIRYGRAFDAEKERHQACNATRAVTSSAQSRFRMCTMLTRLSKLDAYMPVERLGRTGLPGFDQHFVWDVCEQPTVDISWVIFVCSTFHAKLGVKYRISGVRKQVWK